MDKELKEKWVKALRSGAWKQARGRLCDGDAYCCLGILCKVAGLTISTEPGFDGVAGTETETSSWAQYGPVYSLIGDGHLAREFAEGNDNGMSFDQLADLIETRL
jgi:hypothetical protein